MGKTTTDMQLVPIDKLVPYVNNARTHSKEQITKLRSSLREFGFVNPVIIDRDFNVIAGHGRLMAANSFYQVLSAEAYSKHGFNIHGVVFDELHTQPKIDEAGAGGENRSWRSSGASLEHGQHLHPYRPCRKHQGRQSKKHGED